MAIHVTGWQRANVLAACTIACWLCAIAPIGKLGKGFCLILGLTASIQLVKTSQKLVIDEAYCIAYAAMQKELQQTEMALTTHAQERELQRLHGGDEPVYPADVVEELRAALEALVQEEPTSDFPTSEVTSNKNKKSLFLAVNELLHAGYNETFIVEKVLRMGGGSFKKGQQLLQELLQEGKQNEW